MAFWQFQAQARLLARPQLQQQQRPPRAQVSTQTQHNTTYSLILTLDSIDECLLCEWCEYVYVGIIYYIYGFVSISIDDYGVDFMLA